MRERKARKKTEREGEKEVEGRERANDVSPPAKTATRP